jgi:hypothetical protein
MTLRADVWNVKPAFALVLPCSVILRCGRICNELLSGKCSNAECRSTPGGMKTQMRGNMRQKKDIALLLFSRCCAASTLSGAKVRLDILMITIFEPRTN